MEAKEDEEIREEGEQRKNEVSMSAQSQDMDYQVRSVSLLRRSSVVARIFQWRPRSISY